MIFILNKKKIVMLNWELSGCTVRKCFPKGVIFIFKLFYLMFEFERHKIPKQHK